MHQHAETITDFNDTAALIAGSTSSVRSRGTRPGGVLQWKTCLDPSHVELAFFFLRNRKDNSRYPR